jgi:DNA repair protein RadC
MQTRHDTPLGADGPEGNSRAVSCHSIRDLPPREKPRERLERYGAGVLSTAELLAVIVGTGGRGRSALDLGRDLLVRFDLAGLSKAAIDEICTLPGCGPAKALQIKAALELGRRLVASVPEERPQLTSPQEAALMLQGEMALLEQEHLRVVLLNVKNRIVSVHEVYKGSVSSSLVRISEVFREPVRRNCPAVIVAHNHPSGDPTPSAEDIRITRRMVEAGRLLDIEVLDHIIIGRPGWVSLRERGLGFA